MGSRWLHDSLLTSQRWNDLGYAAQVFYVRLVLVVDDFGAFDGRESVIAAHCYPTIRTDVAELLAALHSADLIVRYSNAGKPYIALMRWLNDLRGKRRYPAPPICNESVENFTNVRGKYSRPVGWKNPGGSDQVSILLDAQMRPEVPQPPEWRLVDKDYSPVVGGTQALSTMVSKPYAPGLTAPTHQLVDKPFPQEVELDVEKTQTKTQTKTKTPAAPQHGEQGLQPTATTPTNGEIKLNPNGEWEGVSEAQRLRWQGMFADMSIPDQLERAGQWLLANPAERRQYEGEEDGVRAFLIRWLLRESKSAAKTQ